MKKRIIISAIILLVFGLSSCITINLRLNTSNEDAEKNAEETSADIIDDIIADIIMETKKDDIKIYKGTAQGYNDKINVEVALDGLIIKDITVTSHKETPGIGGELKDKNGKVMTIGGESPITLIPRMMVKNQSINIDTVAGATVTSYGIAHAVVDAMVKADIRVDAMTSPTEDLSKQQNSNEEKQEENKYELTEEEKNLYDPYLKRVNFATRSFIDTTDVIVVGGGGAGLSAALSALENNKKVVLLERNGEVGGDTLVCGAIYNTPDRDYQELLKMDDNKLEVIKNALSKTATSEEEKNLQNKISEDLNNFIENKSEGVFDSEEWYTLQTWYGGDKVANLNLVKTLCSLSYKGYKKLRYYGMKFYDYVSQGAGALWERTHTSKMPMGTGLITTLLSGISNYQYNINIYTHVEAISLIQNENKEVVGVKCRDIKNGMEFEIRCNNGVVLATGGFSANTDLINKYNEKWPDLSNVRTTNRHTCSNGSGILMGTEIGADTVDMKEIQLLYLGNTVNGQLTRYPKRDVNATDQIIFINEEGKRFTNEGGRRDEISKSILNLKRNYFYILESGDGKDYVDINSSEYSSADGFSFDYLKDNGYIIVADTLEELAEKINVDVENLKSTIEDFNKCVDNEKQDGFGRTLYSTKFTKGPYVVTPREVSIHHTMGGLKINEHGEVIDTNGNVIKGLYAAGEVTGGIHGANRIGGNAVVDICVFGDIAGNEVSKKETKKETKNENSSISEKYNLSDKGMKINSANKKILSSLEKAENENIVFSNAGIQSVLKMAELAAASDNKKEILEVNGDFDKNLNSEAVNIYNFMTVNEIQKDVKAKKEYIDELQNNKNIKADLYEIHKYEGIDYVVNDINERIKKETNGQIENGINHDEYKNKDFVAQLGNVIHFLGTWDKVTKEEPYKLKNISFKNKSGKDVVSDFVVINQNDGRLVENNDIIGLTLDYKEDKNRYKFLIFVPKDENTFSIDNINTESINYYTGMQYKLDAKFPKFEFDNNMDLTTIIKSLGIKKLFSEQDADLSNGFDFDKNLINVYADYLKQKAVIRVDEVGTEASALTTIGMVKATAMKEPRKVKIRKVDLTFNRPFYFMIYDRNEDMPLFIGKINELKDNGKEVLDEDKNLPTIIDEVIEEEQY